MAAQFAQSLAGTRLSRSTGSAARAAPVAARATASRDLGLWLPGTVPPKHLDGKLPGDFGFDPLGLGTQPDRLKWYEEAEKTNGRWAMAAVAGILGQEALGVTPRWFDAGSKDYGYSPLALTALEFLLLGFLETKRYQGFKKTGQSGFIDSFPFDPAGLNSESMAIKEKKNGRLAMIAFVGFAVAALVTRQGPIEALFSHINAPFENNILTNIVKIPQTLAQYSAASAPAVAAPIS